MTNNRFVPSPELNDRLAKQRILKENGKYNVAVLPASWNDKLLASAVVSTHRTAYIKGSEGQCYFQCSNG